MKTNSIPKIPKTFKSIASLFLWSGDPALRQVLDKKRAKFIGEGDDESLQILKGSLDFVSTDEPGRIVTYNKVLRRVLLAELIYARDLRPVAAKVLKDSDLWDLNNRLVEEWRREGTLTAAKTDFLFLFRYYVGEDSPVARKRLIKPKLLLGSVKSEAVPTGDIKAIKQKVTFLNHLIIGDSKLYSRLVVAHGYWNAIKLVEALIQNNYFLVPLESKLEFLLAATLTGRDTFLRPMINEEAKRELNHTDPDKMAPPIKLITYYLMTMSKHNFPVRPKKGLSAKAVGDQVTIGLSKYGIDSLEARVDTGAHSNAIYAAKIKATKDDKKVSFVLLDSSYPQYSGKTFTEKVVRKVEVTSSFGHTALRYAVNLQFEFGGKKYRELFTLADRSKMTFPVLLGRRFLENRFLVDVGLNEADN